MEVGKRLLMLSPREIVWDDWARRKRVNKSFMEELSLHVSKLGQPPQGLA